MSSITRLKDKVLELKKDDVDWDNHKIFGYSYKLEEVTDLMGWSNNIFLHDNALDKQAFPSTELLENNVVNFVKELLHLEGGSGYFTSGGTESILLSVKSVRDYYKNSVDHTNRQNFKILIPDTAHPAWRKACNYFEINYIIIPTISHNFKLSYELIKEYLDEDVIMVVTSAYSYGLGRIDEIEKISKLKQQYNFILAVDACIGGFILPFVDTGVLWDFKVTGVDIITIDIHKYGYALKGSAVILYRSKEVAKYQEFYCEDWVGYNIHNSTIQSTKSNHALASSYCVTNYLGLDGYQNIVDKILIITHDYYKILNNIEEFKLLTNLKENYNIIVFQSDIIDLLELQHHMSLSGWYLQVQLQSNGIPDTIHMSVGINNDKVIKEFQDELMEFINKFKGTSDAIKEKR